MDFIKELQKQKNVKIWGINNCNFEVIDKKYIKKPFERNLVYPSDLFNDEKEYLNYLRDRYEKLSKETTKIGKFYSTKDEYKLIKILEDRWIALCKEVEKTKPSHFEINNGKVITPQGTPFHSLRSFNLLTENVDEGNVCRDMLKSISSTGVLCSECFGIFESENEGFFCAFLDRLTKQNPELRKRGDNSVSIQFYFDVNNPFFKELVGLDYFEFERKKAEGESLDGYSPLVIKFLEKIVEPFSPGGRNMYQAYPTWSAIPFGLPPELIIGVMIKGDVTKFSEKVMPIDELAKLFPNAIIMNQEYDLIRESENYLSEENESE